MDHATDLTINQASRRTGFTPATLRYYERLGLLRPAGRSANGYRHYDDAAIERLTFIARAKEVGCTLDEIGGLLAAWDNDCGDVQAQLRDLVGRKIGEAQRQAADVVAFTAQLQAVAATLHDTRPTEGGCGAGCTCLAGTRGSAAVSHGSSGRAPVVLTTIDPTIACSLDGAEMAARIDDWQAVLAFARARSAVDGGVWVELADGAPLDEVLRLARAEQSCCTFFSFAVTVDDRGIGLEVRAPAAAADLVTAVFGAVA